MNGKLVYLKHRCVINTGAIIYITVDTVISPWTLHINFTGDERVLTLQFPSEDVMNSYLAELGITFGTTSYYGYGPSEPGSPHEYAKPEFPMTRRSRSH